MYKSFIFDWSGTLSDNFHCFCKVCDLMFPELGREKITPEEIRREFTLPYMAFWNKYFPDLTPEKEFALYEKYIHQVGDPKIYPGVDDLIPYLFKNGYKLFIVSSDPKSKIIGEVERSGLVSYFEVCYYEKHNKVETIKDLIDTIPLDVQNTFYVGDTSGDVEMGKAAGVKTIALSWGFQNKDGVALSRPDFLFDDILEIKNII